MNLENPDRRLVTDNWEFVERENWTPNASRSLVVLYELQSPVGITSEQIYGMITYMGPKVARKKADHRRFNMVFNCR